MSKALTLLVKEIRKQLPEKGYVALVKKEALSSMKKRVTEDQIKNVYAFRSVAEDKKMIILTASKRTIEKLKKNKSKDIKKLKAA